MQPNSIEASAPVVTTAPPELSIGEILSILWRRRWIVLAITLAGGVAALTTALLLPKKYEAEVLLAPAAQESGSGLGALGGMASRLGGLASLAGISLSIGTDNTAEAVATLQSDALTQRYIEENDLLPILFSRRWDAERQQWKTKKIPTPWRGNEYFKKKVRRVTEDTRTGLVTLSITWTDPELAARWANDLVALANNHLRSKAIEEARRAIAYLGEQAEKTSVVEVRNAIYSLMKSEIEREMLARGREEYALKVVDPAIPPERHTSPSRPLWLIGGLFVGFVLAAFVAIVRERR